MEQSMNNLSEFNHQIKTLDPQVQSISPLSTNRRDDIMKNPRTFIGPKFDYETVAEFDENRG